MTGVSAGLIAYRIRDGALQVLLVHPGGPFWARKDDGAWTFPRGEVAPGEAELDAAIREFNEETGFESSAPFKPLGHVQQKSGKIVHAWAFEGDFDPGAIKSNTFTIEWPPKLGKQQEFPEVDRAEFFNIDDAVKKIRPAEAVLLERLVRLHARSDS